jgi:hypothetical protein
MSASLVALRNDGIATLVLKPSRFFHSGGRGDDLRAGFPDPLQKVLLRQAEMEADHLRRELLHKVADGVVERDTGRRGSRCPWVEPRFSVVALQTPLPACLTRGIGLRRAVTEKS